MKNINQRILDLKKMTMNIKDKGILPTFNLLVVNLSHSL